MFFKFPSGFSYVESFLFLSDSSMKIGKWSLLYRSVEIVYSIMLKRLGLYKAKSIGISDLSNMLFQ